MELLLEPSSPAASLCHRAALSSLRPIGWLTLPVVYLFCSSYTDTRIVPLELTS